MMGSESFNHERPDAGAEMPDMKPETRNMPDIPMPEIPMQEIPIPGVPMPEIPMPDIPMPEIPMREVPMPDIPMREIPMQRYDAAAIETDVDDGSDGNREGEKTDDAESENERPTPRESEEKAREIYGGEEQVSYKDGVEVPYGTPGSTRPDIVIKNPDGSVMAIEVKNYDVRNNYDMLIDTLRKQLQDRKDNLPEGSKQKVVLDVRGQNLTPEEPEDLKNRIKEDLKDIDEDVEVEFITD